MFRFGILTFCGRFLRSRTKSKAELQFREVRDTELEFRVTWRASRFSTCLFLFQSLDFLDVAANRDD